MAGATNTTGSTVGATNTTTASVTDITVPPVNSTAPPVDSTVAPINTPVAHKKITTAITTTNIKVVPRNIPRQSPRIFRWFNRKIQVATPVFQRGASSFSQFLVLSPPLWVVSGVMVMSYTTKLNKAADAVVPLASARPHPEGQSQGCGPWCGRTKAWFGGDLA